MDVVTEFKDRIIAAVVEVARGFPDLLSLTLVGSRAGLNHAEETLNDYDFTFVLKEASWEAFSRLWRELDAVAEALAAPDHYVYVETRLGPVKPWGDTPVVSMIQPLVFDTRSFNNYIQTSPFITLDWSRFAPLVGASLMELFSFHTLTVKELLEARAGIRHYRQMATDESVIMLKPQDDGGMLGRVVESIAIPEAQLPELYNTIITKTMVNALMVFRQVNTGPKGKPLVESFLKTFPKLSRFREFSVRLIETQAAMRAGDPVSIDLKGMRQQTLDFLDALEALCLARS